MHAPHCRGHPRTTTIVRTHAGDKGVPCSIDSRSVVDGDTLFACVATNVAASPRVSPNVALGSRRHAPRSEFTWPIHAAKNELIRERFIPDSAQVFVAGVTAGCTPPAVRKTMRLTNRFP